eukprot:c23135_g1_i3 orf=228-6338(+)
MFSIAAINDVDATQHEWQPLAPTKEAQEFRLTEMYHESLLHLQAGEYKQAQKLLQAIIEDPLSLNAESESTKSSDPMRQLRFLSFRNLAEAFLKQGPDVHKDALQCFLNAVSIDEKDVTLWNRLGTLACSLDSHNIARWAFEQGLQCSPHHWACMEKLIEVLIAIGDEAACLSVVKRLLKISPSHPRAVLIKQVIEDNVDPVELKEGVEKLNNHSVMLRGIDKLKPHHYNLSFSKKRKFEDLTVAKEVSYKNVLQLDLKEASLTELLRKILEAFEGINAKISNIKEGSDMISAAATQDLDRMQPSGMNLEGMSTAVVANAAVTFSLQGVDVSEVGMHIPIMDANILESRMAYVGKDIICDETASASCEKKLKQDASTKLDTFCDKVSTVKEREASTDEEPPLERRSTRLERIRTRNFDKNEELESIQPEVSKSKVSTMEGLLKLLEPFIVCKEILDNEVPPLTLDMPEEENLQASDMLEERNMLCFLRESALNSGVYHLAQKLLEKVSTASIKPLESWTNFLRLEKYIRSASNTLSPCCSLFLAEVYMDMASCLTGELETKECMEDCDYHLCRILGCIAATCSDDNAAIDATMPQDLESMGVKEQHMEEEAKLLYGQLEGSKWSFWLRFYWVSGRLHNHQGNCEKAREDFFKCLRILQARGESAMAAVIVNLQHCKLDKQISVERVQHKLHEVQIQGLLSHSAVQMLEGGQYSDLIELLAPILFSEAGNKGVPLIAGKKHATDFSTELTALNFLISACEKCEPKNFNVALQSYNQRMHIHLFTAGIVKVKGLPKNLVQGAGQSQAEGTDRDWFKVVAEEVKRISRFLGDFDQKVSDKSLTVLVDAKLLGCMQQLLLTVMCHLLALRGVPRFSVSDPSEQSEATCFVDAAVSFCRLQHLHSGTSVEEQVELLVRVHDLLAEQGLCCAGKACEGGEGVFLKMAIKHFLLLEMKLKSTIPEENASIADETYCDSKDEDCKEVAFASLVCEDGVVRADDVFIEEKTVEELEESSAEKSRKTLSSAGFNEEVCDIGKRKNDLGLDIALDQSFFCLYGLNLRGGLESSGSQDGLAVHANTSLGDYQTKEQCAEVFQYLLPYARVCTKSCLVKLRKVLRAIRQHFPDPPESVLENNAVDNFLDDMDLDESKLSCMIFNHAGIREISGYALKIISPTKSYGVGTFEEPHTDASVGEKEGNQTDGSHTSRMFEDDNDSKKAGLYQEVYKNLYYLLTQVEEASASDKWPGFVFTKEGEDFVEQNAKLIKYDLMYNIDRFESWHKLASLYDEEVDLMLNDGSKTCSALEWHKNASLIKRVEIGRRRTRRCLLMSMALAKTPEQERSVHELLALVYYDTLQNVAPSFNQRHHIAVRDAAWQEVCQKSLQHFKKALSFRSEWMYLFYLGKLCEKLDEPCEVVLTYYQNAVHSNPSAVDSLYRLHASRLKLLCTRGTNDLDIMKVVAKYSYDLDTQEQVHALIQDSQPSDNLAKDGIEASIHVLPELADKGTNSAWNILLEDGMKALEVCIEGELKHYHKARYRLAQCLYARNKGNDLERAKDELGFCFKSNRSLFIINMWEIDGSTKKNRRKMPGSNGARRSYEITMPESSRKFITCLRKYLLFYFHLCEKTLDICTLEKAYNSLRVDKKFSLCLADMVHVALGKYIHTLGAAISQFDTAGMVPNLSLKNLLERFFNLFMEHGGSLSDVVAVSLAEAGISSAIVVSENSIHSYIHRYLQSLEQDYKVDILESVNEKIKKRFKTPKLVKEVCARVCKHAAIAWCRCLCASLCAITPLQTQNIAMDSTSDGIPLNKQEQLTVELKIDELFSNMSDFSIPAEEVNSMQQFGPLSCMSKVQIQQAIAENMDRATALLRQAFIFYRDCTGPFPAGINLFLVQLGPVSADEILATTLPFSSALVGVDLSVPRKLLLWAYTLVHGHTCSIAEAVRFCEEQAKTRVKKGVPHASPPVSFQDKPALKDATQCTNDIVVDDKEKPITEEHDTPERGSQTLVCSSDTSSLCTMAPASLPADDPVQKEEKCRTSVFDFVGL